ncbi:MAG: hypothetical protein LBQ22_11925 [Bacteroidales bacterium]|nr:hypothetical protein [Bacteroidales bacterium]
MKKILLLYLSLLLSVFCVYGQETDKPRSTRPLTKWEKRFGQVKYGNNVYRKGSNWFSVGYGLYGYNINKKAFNRNFSLAYHHRYKGVYFNGGWHFSSPNFFTDRPMDQVNDIHAGAGLRFEDRWYHFSFFIGPSFATTWTPNELNPKESFIHHQLGAHVEIQTIFKYFYDLGIGAALYGSFNKRYQVVGVQLQLYFSNAFVSKY